MSHAEQVSKEFFDAVNRYSKIIAAGDAKAAEQFEHGLLHGTLEGLIDRASAEQLAHIQSLTSTYTMMSEQREQLP